MNQNSKNSSPPLEHHFTHFRWCAEITDEDIEGKKYNKSSPWSTWRRATWRAPAGSDAGPPRWWSPLSHTRSSSPPPSPCTSSQPETNHTATSELGTTSTKSEPPKQANWTAQIWWRDSYRAAAASLRWGGGAREAAGAHGHGEKRHEEGARGRIPQPAAPSALGPAGAGRVAVRRRGGLRSHQPRSAGGKASRSEIWEDSKSKELSPVFESDGALAWGQGKGELEFNGSGVLVGTYNTVVD